MLRAVEGRFRLLSCSLSFVGADQLVAYEMGDAICAARPFLWRMASGRRSILSAPIIRCSVATAKSGCRCQRSALFIQAPRTSSQDMGLRTFSMTVQMKHQSGSGVVHFMSFSRLFRAPHLRDIQLRSLTYLERSVLANRRQPSLA